MNLVMFRFAVEHISKVARVLKLENGNAMLIGIGGSGRQSCSRMATYLADYDIFQIVIAKGKVRVKLLKDGSLPRRLRHIPDRHC